VVGSHVGASWQIGDDDGDGDGNGRR